MTQPDKHLVIDRLKRMLDQIPSIRQLALADPQFTKWRRDTRVAIRHAFGGGSKEVAEFERTVDISTAGTGQYYQEGLSDVEATLRSMIDEIEVYWGGRDASAHEDRVPRNTRRLFIVHGRDAGAKAEVARFVEMLDLEPTVLAEMPSEGKTIIEKFEAYAEVGYAVVLLTADDSGALKGQMPQPRARQNVIFELGFFIGKLGRERVCALTRGEPEVPSDYAGVAYIPLDSSGAWRMSLIRELKAAGLEVDANKAI